MFFKATRTAWAQTSQSIPKTVNSTWRNSACAVVAASNKIIKTAVNNLFIKAPNLIRVYAEKGNN
jgi:hypothetical protein